MWRTDSLEKILMLGKIEGRGEGDNIEWDGWMASPTLWTWVWASFGSWWCAGKPGVLQSMELQRVRHDWVTEMNWIELNWEILCVSVYDSGFWIENRLWKVKGNLGDQWRGCCSGPVIQLMTQLGWWLGDFKWLVSQDIFEILSIQFGDGLNIWYEKKKKGGKRHQGWSYGFCPETVKLRWGSLWIEKVLDVGGGRH